MAKYSYKGKSYKTKEAARAASKSDKAKSGGGSSLPTTPVTTPSNSKTTPTAPTPTVTGGGSNSAQLAAMKATLEKASADLRAGNVTGLAPSNPLSPKMAGPTPSPYSGPSVVDYLASKGQASDFGTRSRLAAQQGIVNYTGSAAQNTQLLMKLNTKASIPSTAITNGQTPQDVMDKRAMLENLQGQLKTKQQELADLLAESAKDVTDDEGFNNMNPLTEPDKYLSQYFSMDAARTMTPAQKEQQKLLDDAAKETEDFYGDRDDQIEGAYDKFGVDDKAKALGNLQKEMAQREVKLRNDVQVLETAPEFRGVSREFANDQREAIKSKGAFDLANLAIVESAYNGDLKTSRDLAQDLIENQFKTFEGKIEGFKARLAALMPQLDAEEKKQAIALEAAFDQQARNLAAKKADTELRYEYMTLAAKAGAPESVYKSILKAKSADEAFMLAAPYLKEKPKVSSSSSSDGTLPVAGLPQGLSTGADQVLKGIKAISDFTPSERTKIQTELGKLGFNKPEPANWFGTEFLAGQGITLDQNALETILKKNYARGLPAGVLERVIQEDIVKVLKILWNDYRDSVFGIGSAATKDSGSGDDLDSRIDGAFDE